MDYTSVSVCLPSLAITKQVDRAKTDPSSHVPLPSASHRLANAPGESDQPCRLDFSYMKRVAGKYASPGPSKGIITSRIKDPRNFQYLKGEKCLVFVAKVFAI